jgi:hypothetical protein
MSRHKQIIHFLLLQYEFLQEIFVPFSMLTFAVPIVFFIASAAELLYTNEHTNNIAEYIRNIQSRYAYSPSWIFSYERR